MSENHDDRVRSFVKRTRELLVKEREAEIEQSHLLLSNCGPKLLEIKGLLLAGLGVVGVSTGLGGKTLVELHRPLAYHTSPLFPPNTFRPGDLARIEPHTSETASSSKKPKKTPSRNDSSLEGVIYKMSDSRVIVALDVKDDSEVTPEIPERCRDILSVKLANSITFDRMDRAINHLEAVLLPNSGLKAPRVPPEVLHLTSVLLGSMPIGTSRPLEDMTFLDGNLNPSQQDAVKFALQAAEVACIHGPPGTGKTQTLVEIIRQLVAQSKVVLVCGASNLAVDNLLERLAPHGISLTRIGHPARVLESVHGATLDSQTARSDEASLAKDAKKELDDILSQLDGKSKGKLKGAERRKMWEEVRELRKEYRRREGGVVKSVLKQANVVLATCHSAGGRQLSYSLFDVCVIDEATQAMEAVCWIPIFLAKKVILAGDPQQLPPIIISLSRKERKHQKQPKSTAASVPEKAESKDDGATTVKSDSQEASDVEDPDQSEKLPGSPPISAVSSLQALRPPESLEVTLFERLERMYGKRIKRMLTVQYRMHEDIASFPSTTLYNSKLEAHITVAKHLLKELPGVSQDEAYEDVVGVPVIFFDTAGCEFFERLDGGDANDEGSKSNENEAQLVKKWVEQLVEAGVADADIAVITPYQAQVTLLTSLLQAQYSALEIGTVDGMQGREKEAVILSLVRSNDKREVGFLKDKRRLNVAMTRPRRHLCVIGDSSTVQHGGSYLKAWLSWLEQNADVRFAEM